MDLENNIVGRRIGAQFPPLVGTLFLEIPVEAAASNGELAILDDPSNWGRAGLLKPSR